MSQAGVFTESGFSLLEVLLVLAVLALIGTVAGIALPGTRDRLRLMDAAGRITSLLVEARADARRTGEARFVVFDLDSRRVAIHPDLAWQSMPESVGLLLVSARETGSARQPSIAFLSDGMSSGGEVTIVSGPLRAVYRVEWLTGRVHDGKSK